MRSPNFFKALADETRLRLINLLSHYELNVNEIVEILNMGQSRISRHLKILADHYLLTFRRDGLWSFYSAPAEGAGSQFIKAINYLFKDEEIFPADLLAAKQVIKKRSNETILFFDSIAEDWEQLKSDIFGGFRLNEYIMDQVSFSKTSVDLGCGTGDLLAYLQKVSDHVIGVDKSPKMLEEARKRFMKRKEKIDLRIGDIEHLPLGNREADLAIINMVLHHIPSPLEAFKEINRILKPKSHFIIVDFLNHNNESLRQKYGDRWLGFSELEIENWLAVTGFNSKKVDYFNLNKGLRGIMIRSMKT
jgi:ubiquinone/menaquinone biosynthesis C-methylase UbiE